MDDTSLIPFVDTEAAARYLALSPHSLECYRSLGGDLLFHKFGKFVRYAVPDLLAWAAAGGTSEPQARTPASTRTRVRWGVQPVVVASGLPGVETKSNITPSSV